MGEYINIFIKSAFIENMVLAYFLGMCSYLAVSKTLSTAFGLGMAVIFVLGITMPINWLINEYLLVSFELEFLRFIIKHLPHYVLIGHNSGAYDSLFVARELCALGIRYESVNRGNRILSLTIPAASITFKDFFLFFSSSLANIAKSFGIREDQQKQFFPYSLLRDDKFSLRLSHLPPKSAYEPHRMPPDRRRSFEVWHEAHKEESFCLNSQAISYCLSDVFLLHRIAFRYIKSCLEVEAQVKEASGTDPPETGGTVIQLLADPMRPPGEDNPVLNVATSFIPPFARSVVTASTYVSLLSRAYIINASQQLPVLKDQSHLSGKKASSYLEIIFLIHLKRRHPELICAYPSGEQKCVTVEGHRFYLDAYRPDTQCAIEVLGC